jgi:hypothetical protein
MSSQSDNVVTFVWPPVHQGIELFQDSIASHGSVEFCKKYLMVKTLAASTKIRHIDQ